MNGSDDSDAQARKANVTVTPKELKLSKPIPVPERVGGAAARIDAGPAGSGRSHHRHAFDPRDRGAGHTDSGGPGYAQRLSQERAQAAVEALVKLGVDPNKLTAKGYGRQAAGAAGHGSQQGKEPPHPAGDHGPRLAAGLPAQSRAATERPASHAFAALYSLPVGSRWISSSSSSTLRDRVRSRVVHERELGHAAQAQAPCR